MSKNCVVYLSGTRTEDMSDHRNDLNDFSKSIDLIKKNLCPYSDFDIIVLHEKGFPLEFLESQNIPCKVIPYEIDLTPPDSLENVQEYFPHPTHGNGPVAYGHPGFSLGYRGMCRLFSGELYKLDIIQEYDYYMRLDTDSFVERMNYDVFKYVKENDCKYGYIEPAVQIDNPKVVLGLWDCVGDWADKNDHLIHPNKIQNGMMYYTNFEIGSIDWFTNSKYNSFYEHIDASGGIFNGRWGDAPIRFLGVNMLMDRQHIQNIPNLTYTHGSTYNT